MTTELLAPAGGREALVAAVQSGASIYCDETAPQTYQSTAELLRLDIMANLAMDKLTVVLCYESTDGRPIFTVSSSGAVWTCWE